MYVASNRVDDSITSCSSKTRCYYISGSSVPFDEDVTHEFKGHKNLSEDEIPPWTQIANSDRRTRGPVSKCLNGFLNNEYGGTVYLGILDNGTVNGFFLTQFQKDHVRVSLDDLMQRYQPPVEEHRYTVKFVPIVDKDSSEEDIARIVSYDSTKNVNSDRRQTPHVLREYQRCWCEQDRIAQFRCGVMAPCYVIEIIIKPWDRDDPRNKYAVGKMKAVPIHEDETGCVNFRRQATVVSYYNMQQLSDISKAMVHNHYEPKISRLRQELQQMRQAYYHLNSDRNTVQPNEHLQHTSSDG